MHGINNEVKFKKQNVTFNDKHQCVRAIKRTLCQSDAILVDSKWSYEIYPGRRHTVETFLADKTLTG